MCQARRCGRVLAWAQVQCTDWLSATQNGRGVAERLSTHQESNPCCPTLCYSPWFVSITRKKRYMTRRISPPAIDFFAHRTVVLGLFKLNIKARHDIPELLNANLWSIHLIIDASYHQYILNIHLLCYWTTIHNSIHLKHSSTVLLNNYP